MDKSDILKRIRALTKPIAPQRFNHATRPRRLTGIKCVAFDFYGTMFISGAGDIGVDEEQASAYTRIFDEAIQQIETLSAPAKIGETGINFFQHTIERHIDQKKEQGIDYPEPDILEVWQEVLQSLADDGYLQISSVDLETIIRFAIEFEFRANTVWPVPELDVLLQNLLKKELKLGIISNSQFYTPLAFEALTGQSTDDAGFEPGLQKWSYVYGVKKPSIHFYTKFTDELPHQNLRPENVLYVGNDLFKDIIPAKKLNMRTALYVGDQRSVRHKKDDLTAPDQQPDIIIDDLHQIINWVR